MTHNRESAFTELLKILRDVRNILREQRINTTALLCALGLMFVANHFFWVAIVFFHMSMSKEYLGSTVAYAYAKEMLYTCDVVAILALAFLYVAFRERILTRIRPNRKL